LTIIYYVSVVSTEIYVLTEESKRASMKKATARRMSAKGVVGKSKRSLTVEEMSAGGMDTQMNPLLIKDGTVNVGTRSADQIITPELEALVDGLLSQKERPPLEVWQVFQATYAQLHSANGEAAGLLAEAKERLQRVQAGLAPMTPSKKASLSEQRSEAPQVLAPEFAGSDEVAMTSSPLARIISDDE
jgi:hypothetical protein